MSATEKIVHRVVALLVPASRENISLTPVTVSRMMAVGRARIDRCGCEEKNGGGEGLWAEHGW